jgi:hypothetical protein
MSDEFLDYVEDVLDAMDKAEALIRGVAYHQFEADLRINLLQKIMHDYKA